MRWYYHENGSEVGPLSEQALGELHRAGRLPGNTLIRREDSTEWQELSGMLNTLSAPEPQAKYVPSSSRPPRQWNIRKISIIIGVLAAIWVLFQLRSCFTGGGNSANAEQSTSAGRLPRITKPVPKDFRLIPAGKFVMGDTLDGFEDAPPHEVDLSDFYIGEYEVTQELWTKVRDWALKHGYSDLPEGKGDSANHPVYWVNVFHAIKWCNARSEMDRLRPCYSLHGKIYRIGDADGNDRSALKCDFEANGYRLPTEAEWEKAARGGKDGQRFPWGNTINQWKANYTAYYGAYPYQEPITWDQEGDPGNSDSRRSQYREMIFRGEQNPDRSYKHYKTSGGEPFTIPVGNFEPNGYGLYDMAGNASEWCWDFYEEDYYLKAPRLNPTGPARGHQRVNRGGGGGLAPTACRVAARRYDWESNLTHSFRVVRR